MASNPSKDARARRFAYLPDSHGVFSDPEAVACAMAFVRAHKPEVVICGGDHVDFYALSRFDKDPRRALELQDDLDAGAAFVAAARKAAPNAKLYYLQGNHEARLTRWLFSKAAELVNLRGMNVPSLLGLNRYKCRYVESGALQMGAILFKHGNVVRSRAGYTATGELEREGVSGCSGHTHRIGEVSKTNRGGTYKWVEAGCLCQLTPEYMVGQIPDWQHGLAYGAWAGGGSKRFSLHTAHIIDGKTMYGDKVVSA